MDLLVSTKARVRTPWLDQYFVFTSSLGTHTFFMTGLPACFFFGYDQFGRGCVYLIRSVYA
jgi:dihydrosphingosine 1-phosphate phosphatase